MTLALAAVAGPCVRAADYVAEPRFDAGLDWYDNRTLARDAPIATWLGTVAAGASLARRTARSRASVAPRVVAGRHSSGRLRDTEDVYVRAEAGYDFERVQLAFAGDRSQVTSLNSADVDSGIFRADVRRTTLDLAPSLAWAFSERATVNLTGLRTQVHYDGPAQGQSDYDYSLAGIAIGHAFSDTGRVDLAFDRTEFRTLGTSTRIVTHGGRATLARTLDEATRVEAMLGFNVSAIDAPVAAGANPPDRASGAIYDVRFVRAWARGEAALRYGRTLSPTGNGDQQVATRLGLTVRHDWSQRLQGRLEYARDERTAQAGLSGSLSNTGDFASGTLAWKLSPNWRLEARYAWQRLRPGEAGGDAIDGHALGVALRYAGDLLTVQGR